MRRTSSTIQGAYRRQSRRAGAPLATLVHVARIAASFLGKAAAQHATDRWRVAEATRAAASAGGACVARGFWVQCATSRQRRDGLAGQHAKAASNVVASRRRTAAT
eukprot:724227-Prymnesium_polylepis.2